MASFDGLRLHQWLIDRGWEDAPGPDGWCGDPLVRRDGGPPLDVWGAVEEHRRRTGGWPDFLPPPDLR